MTPTRKTIVRHMGLSAALAFAAYAPSLSGAFLRDDLIYIVGNETLRDPSLWPGFFYDKTALLAHSSMAQEAYRPLAGLLYALLYSLAGLRPFWYHLLNSLLHAFNTAWIYLLALRLLRVPRTGGGPEAPEPDGRAIALAWSAALLFCLHPAQVESVAYIGSLPTVLSFFFCLAALLLYLPGASGSPESMRGAGSVAAFAMGLLSKESAAAFPIVLAAYDLTLRPGGDAGRAAPRWKAWLPYWTLSAAYLGIRHLVLGRTAQIGAWGGSWPLHFQMAVRGLFQDLRIALWPSRLRPCYSFVPEPGFVAESALMLLSAAALLAAILLAVRRRKFAGFACAFFLAGLLPVSNLVPMAALAADRFLYLPLAGSALLFAYLLRRFKPLWIALAGGLLSSLMMPASLERQLAWQDSFQLDLAAHSTAPKDPCTSLYLALHYYQWGMLDRAHALASPATISPILGKRAYLALAKIAVRQGRYGLASAHLERSLRLDPNQRDARELRERVRGLPDGLSRRNVSASKSGRSFP